MARAINKLSARGVQTLSTPGRHSDGGGLYLIIDRGGAKRWAFLYRRKRDGRQSEMGLGSAASVSLADARSLAASVRQQIAAGIDPVEARRSTVEAQRRASTSRTFGAVADELIAAKSPGWRNEKHRAQWRMTLDVYAPPLRDKEPADVTTEDVLAVLQPIWSQKPETATRTRGRIEAVIDAARVRGLILPETANPAR